MRRRTDERDRVALELGRIPLAHVALAAQPGLLLRDPTVPVSSCPVQRGNFSRWVPHQARHSLATSLLRAGASLTHVRRYLGHVSERMAEHYIDPRELHQTGEKSQVTCSRREPGGLRRYYDLTS
ncbi:tyrosine-type recombinase/integrase [Streptomyces sp. NPDC056161]|uniref:tyrosine-type recombinase/integrase n=1 Tax=Streptomyces sp. NPDC056161 TaxID=3345732 RepID=UPI0035E09EF8